MNYSFSIFNSPFSINKEMEWCVCAFLPPHHQTPPDNGGEWHRHGEQGWQTSTRRTPRQRERLWVWQTPSIPPAHRSNWQKWRIGKALFRVTTSKHVCWKAQWARYTSSSASWRILTNVTVYKHVSPLNWIFNKWRKTLSRYIIGYIPYHGFMG